MTVPQSPPRDGTRDGAHSMKKQHGILVLAGMLLSAAVFLGYQRWGATRGTPREELLALLPADPSAVIFLDFEELRHAPFMAKLYEWAPKPESDADYAQFVKDTGFDYERDLYRVAFARRGKGQDSAILAIADGKFDRAKISSYASRSGSVEKKGEREIYSVPSSGTRKKISFVFLKKDRIAVTDEADLSTFLNAKHRKEDIAEWRTRFERLAGSPVFAVIRQDAGAGAALAAQAPGGLRSPQLSTLLDQLQWITLAGKPDNEILRVVAEGESTTDATVRQLVDLLNGVVVLAQAGLNDFKTRQQLDPAAREAYLELLKSADISKLDRGDTKSVRLVLDITPKLLAAARTATPAQPDAAPAKPAPQRSTAQKKGRT
jgi:hypothetical protein